MTVSISSATFELFDDEGDLSMTVTVDDDGGGKFFAIKTERWTFDDVASMTATLDRIRAKFSDEEWD